MIRRLLRKLALEHNRCIDLWRRMARPGIADWTEYLRRHGGFHAFGQNCGINPESYIGDRALVSIGNNVHVAGGWIVCHDGSVNMVNQAIGSRYDAVRPVIIHDDVFIGHGAMILPGATIGPRAVVGAGAVVSGTVPANSVVAGNPARVICSFDDYAAKLKLRNADLPWRGLIEARKGGFDPAIEPELTRMRVAHYYGPSTS